GPWSMVHGIANWPISWTMDHGPCDRDQSLEDVAAEVLVLDDLGEHFLDVGGINADRFLLQIRTFERNLVQKLLHNRMQPSGADVFRAFVHGSSKARDLLNRIVLERQLDALSFKQRNVLFDQRVLWFGENADEIFDR